DTEDNGLALCLFHHRALDRGALGIDQDHTLMVSQHAIGSVGLPDWLHRYAGRPLRTPVPGGARPHEDHISWHQREVFKSPARLATSP
ncbi:MAG TPA: restriction endonuclease, partial [Myxococcota bacterium]|nr:restriction endonuclease [Myxococcota bacterium]